MQVRLVKTFPNFCIFLPFLAANVVEVKPLFLEKAKDRGWKACTTVPPRPLSDKAERAAATIVAITNFMTKEE